MAGIVPDYMVPSIIKPVVEFPLVANGKLDRAALLANIQSEGLSDRTSEQGNEIEKRIAAIWRHVLQRDDIALDEDFRALGGGSLSTMDLALEIEKMFGVVFSSDDLASPLTISRLAANVRAQLGDMEPGNSTRPPGKHETSSKVFAISYPWVMDRMPEVIGQALSAGRWQHVQVPFTYFRTASTVTIEDMAAHLDHLICSLSPEGPYILYGQCFTGLLAYEVAQRLVAAGHTVSMVVIVDSYPIVPRMSLKRAKSLLRRAARFAKLNLKPQMDKLRGKLFPVRVVRYVDLIRETCTRASNQYRPRPYRGHLVFFRPRDLTALTAEQDLTAWRRLALGQFTEHVVDLHDQGRETAESVQSGYIEIATKLNEMRLVLLAEGRAAARVDQNA
jgi:acyl carrier protein